MGAAGAPVPALVANPVLLLGPVIGVALALAVGIALVAAARAVVALVAAARATALVPALVAAFAVAPATHLVVAVVAAVALPLALALAIVRVALAVSVASVSRIVAGERVVEGDPGAVHLRRGGAAITALQSAGVAGCAPQSRRCCPRRRPARGPPRRTRRSTARCRVRPPAGRGAPCARALRRSPEGCARGHPRSCPAARL